MYISYYRIYIYLSLSHPDFLRIKLQLRQLINGRAARLHESRFEDDVSYRFLLVLLTTVRVPRQSKIFTYVTSTELVKSGLRTSYFVLHDCLRDRNGSKPAQTLQVCT